MKKRILLILLLLVVGGLVIPSFTVSASIVGLSCDTNIDFDHYSLFIIGNNDFQNDSSVITFFSHSKLSAYVQSTSQGQVYFRANVKYKLEGQSEQTLNLEADLTSYYRKIATPNSSHGLYNYIALSLYQENFGLNLEVNLFTLTINYSDYNNQMFSNGLLFDNVARFTFSPLDYNQLKYYTIPLPQVGGVDVSFNPNLVNVYKFYDVDLDYGINDDMIQTAIIKDYSGIIASSFGTGLYVGYANGYQDGLNGEVGLGSFWTIISSVFQGVQRVMNIQIVPGVNLGLLIAVPIAIALVGFILWIWRKNS